MDKTEFLAWRRRLGLTQVAAAKLLHITDRQVQYYEAGKSRITARAEQACHDIALKKRLFSREGGVNDSMATPWPFFRRLNREFRFTLDACATTENAKVRCFISPEEDALSQEWTGRVFCNPPYSKLRQWTEHGWRQLRNGAELVAFLVPPRTDTSWWHEIVLPHAAEIRFVQQRVFALSRSVLVVFRRGHRGRPKLTSMDV